MLTQPGDVHGDRRLDRRKPGRESTHQCIAGGRRYRSHYIERVGLWMRQRCVETLVNRRTAPMLAHDLRKLLGVKIRETFFILFDQGVSINPMSGRIAPGFIETRIIEEMPESGLLDKTSPAGPSFSTD